MGQSIGAGVSLFLIPGCAIPYWVTLNSLNLFLPLAVRIIKFPLHGTVNR